MRFIVALSFISMLSGSAFAADAIVRREDPIPVPPAVAPAASYDWSGIYLGVDGGFKGFSLDFAPNDQAEAAGFGRAKATAKGGFVGGYIGYNYQIDNWVIGAEGDAQFHFGKADTDEILREYAAVGEAKGFGSLRARLGYAVDRFMPYVTGGVALEHLKLSTKDGDKLKEDSKTRLGYTLGAGVDYAITDNWIGKVEYQFMDFGKKSYDLNIGSADLSSQSHTVRIGLSYKF